MKSNENGDTKVSGDNNYATLTLGFVSVRKMWHTFKKTVILVKYKNWRISSPSLEIKEVNVAESTPLLDDTLIQRFKFNKTGSKTLLTSFCS